LSGSVAVGDGAVGDGADGVGAAEEDGTGSAGDDGAAGVVGEADGDGTDGAGAAVSEPPEPQPATNVNATPAAATNVKIFRTPTRYPPAANPPILDLWWATKAISSPKGQPQLQDREEKEEGVGRLGMTVLVFRHGQATGV
jgi:hypothetical protein